jgi:membrane associated rhomboid family serine protease
VSDVDNPLQGAFPRPGKVLRAVLIGVFTVWLAFAVGLNWAGASEAVFYALCGNTERILHGEVWRLFTAPWLHMPVGTLSHVLSAMLGLYFLSPPLESRWGSARFARFLLVASLCAYGTQMLAELVLPGGLAARVAGDGGYFYGALPVVEAIAIAWALSFRGQTVRLFFVLPVTSTGLIVFVVATSLMYVVIAAQGPSGLVAPFGGMLAGWLFGGGSPSPFRRFWLKLRLAKLDAEAAKEARDRRRRAGKSGLRVISGGRDSDADPDKPPESRDRDGRWLN